MILAGHHTNLAHYLGRIIDRGASPGDLLETQAIWRECLALAYVVRMVLAHGHGGMILVVPENSESWISSLSSFPYQFSIPDTSIRDVIRQELNYTNTQDEVLQRVSEADIPDELKSLVIASMGSSPWGGMGRGVRATASLAGVDGAIVVTRDMRVLGFGAKVGAQNDRAPAIYMFKPQPGQQEVVQSLPEALGGTRHQSAARFVAANKDSLALVVSQDRHISVLHWHEPVDGVAVVRNAEWWV